MADQESPSEYQISTSRVSNIRSLTSAEIDTLVQLLGSQIDRKHLAHWVSESITIR
jgi:hypothetical protein